MNSRKRLDFNMESVLNLTSDMEVGSFFYARNQRSSEEWDTGKTMQMKTLEVEVVRVKIKIGRASCRERVSSPV